MEKSVEIKELKLKLGKKEIMLTIEEARKLKKALEEVFGKEVIKEEHIHHHDHSPYRWWFNTTYTDMNQVWCSDNTTTKLTCDNAVAELTI